MLLSSNSSNTFCLGFCIVLLLRCVFFECFHNCLNPQLFLLLLEFCNMLLHLVPFFQMLFVIFSFLHCLICNILKLVLALDKSLTKYFLVYISLFEFFLHCLLFSLLFLYFLAFHHCLISHILRGLLLFVCQFCLIMVH